MHTFYDVVRSRREMVLTQDEQQDLIEKIKVHPETKVLGRSDFAEAYGFIENLYPSLREIIQNTKVYQNENTAFCAKLGFPKQAAGVFLIKAKAILLCWGGNKFPDHVILVHELLHYCSKLLGSRSTSRDVEEDFAYVNSLPYLRKKGYSDTWIAEQYLLPFYQGKETSLMQSAKGKPLTYTEKEAAKQKALAYCKSICNKSIGEVIAKPVAVTSSRFDFL